MVAVRSIPVSRSREPKRREAQRRERSSALDRGALFRRLFAVLVLAVCVLTALLAVPDLRPVLHEVGAMNPALVIAAVVLELASCLSFLVIFRAFFPEIPKRVARELAWSQMGSGALLPGGGVGSLAAGGWLLHLVGMPTREIVQRSSGLFFLTSAINVLTLTVAAVLLLLGIGTGPHDVLRTGLPVIAAVSATILVLGLPRLTRVISANHPEQPGSTTSASGFRRPATRSRAPAGAW
jgi:hypothetical protein